MENAYGLDADYFNRLFARELKPDIVRNQTPTCLARLKQGKAEAKALRDAERQRWTAAQITLI
ncbi:hypothetical protein CW360_03030 [Pseudomonas fluvialis]|uniref:Uncharacterized protein n=1 Tax=Pseudomonas fluvialis TaxID=1793966 RepID=A0A2I0CTL2_9PSED|nr:hypothetical protein [Pseudomonas pharmacofabricae]PKF72703.1 hypothetical protein CW360_03030 [Pseudomonas pharmacofabricae]